MKAHQRVQEKGWSGRRYLGLYLRDVTIRYPPLKELIISTTNIFFLSNVFEPSKRTDLNRKTRV